MATRAALITKIKTELQDLHFNQSTTDTAAFSNLYHFALNNAMGQLGYDGTDTQIASIDVNEQRRICVGAQYYFISAVIKKLISRPRLDADTVSRDEFGRTMQFLNHIKKEWEDVLTGADSPAEISKTAESVVPWGSINDGGSSPNSEGDNFQQDDRMYIDDMGSMRGEFNDGD